MQFPRTHLIAAAACCTLLLGAAIVTPSANTEAKRVVISLSSETAVEAATEQTTEPDTSTQTLALADDELSAPATEPALAISTDADTAETQVKPETVADTTVATVAAAEADVAALTEPAITRTVETVRSGDTLSNLFTRAGISHRQMYELLQEKTYERTLRRLHPGYKVAFAHDAGRLVSLEVEQSALESLRFTRTAQDSAQFDFEKIERSPDVQPRYAQATIESSLFVAGQKAGLSNNMIMKLANLFGWDIDFVLDIREGDEFGVVYEELHLDGDKMGDGEILAATFANRGRTYSAVRYTDSKGNTDYFTPEGDSIRKAFLRSPVDFARISSHFNLRRKHPVLHKIRAHRGTDYAAGYGTPIRATGDGKVVLAGRKGGYGRTVIIQHGQRYSTLYAHMQKYGRGIRNGARVKQGQIIGYVGSSGLATGPHLHYEFRENGVHKNPVTVKLPKAQPVQDVEKERFLAESKSLLEQLHVYRKSYQLALLEN